TDATPTNSACALALLTRAVQSGQLLQRVLLMGDEQLPEPEHSLLTRGPLKILLDDYRLPPFEQLCQRIARGHRQGRAVAIHCVTSTELVFALSALLESGTIPGDRIEHASVTPDAALALLRETAVTVVTQPGFVRERGDQYLAEVEPREQAWLYRCRSLVDHGIPLGGSTDAPYGSADPWSAMAAAVQRRTRAGRAIGSSEQLTPERALALFTSAPTAPGGPARHIEPGMPADLCLLDRPWAEARRRLTADDVAATIRGGEVIYRRGAATAHAPD
ncbi:MAG: amidohydrolase family protein, partial [Halioglobus sp.]|nr:amidohydrolase family protein [Halioglobus sp.]